MEEKGETSMVRRPVLSRLNFYKIGLCKPEPWFQHNGSGSVMSPVGRLTVPCIDDRKRMPTGRSFRTYSQVIDFSFNSSSI